MIREPRTRLPVRLLRGDERDHVLVVDEVVQSDGRADPGQPGRVRDDVTHEQVRLPELGPIRHHRCIELELAALEQEEQADRDKALGAREHHLDRVLAPGRARLLVRRPAPEIDDGFAVDHGRESRAVLRALGETALELLRDELEAHGRSRARPNGRQKSAPRT